MTLFGTSVLVNKHHDKQKYISLYLVGSPLYFSHKTQEVRSKNRWAKNIEEESSNEKIEEKPNEKKEIKTFTITSRL